MNKKFYAPNELAELAKKAREQSGDKKADVAREFKVNRSSVSVAEEKPDVSMTALRIRIIEKYSPYKVTGPFYMLEKK
jgi:hypothetical protein